MWSLKRDGNTFLIPTLRHPPRWGVGPTDSGPWLYLSRSPWRPQLPYPLRPQPRNWNPHRTSNLGHSHIPSETKLDCSSRETTAAGGSRQTVDVPTCLNHPAADEATQNSGPLASDFCPGPLASDISFWQTTAMTPPKPSSFGWCWILVDRLTPSTDCRSQ